MSKEAMKLALEALEWAEFLADNCEATCQEAKHSVDKAITALREALAEDEPVVWGVGRVGSHGIKGDA